MTNAPPHFKKWVAFLRRAEELDAESRADPDLGVVAFYCRKYVVEQASRTLPNPMGDVFLMHLLDELGHKKAQLGVSQEQGQALCTTHALMLFAKAVKQKETEESVGGRASKSTAKLFYSASTLLDILGQFDSATDAATEEKRKYAKHQAIEIAKNAGPESSATPALLPIAPVPAASTVAATTSFASAPAPPAPAAQVPLPITTITAATAATSAAAAAAPTLAPAPVSAPSHLFAALGQKGEAAHVNTSSAGFAESCRLIRACAKDLLENENWHAAQEQLEMCVLLRCANTKVKDAVELCYYAIAAKKAANVAKANTFLVDAERRLA